jgi:PST family polysaccharide transporter
MGRDVINVVGRVVLARLLWPEAFGFFTLAFAVAFGVKLAVQLQIEAAIIQRRNLDDDLLSTAHWSLMALSGAGALLLAGLAKPIGDLLTQPATVPLLRFLSLYLLIDGAGGVPRAWLLRDMAFRKLTWVGLGSEGAGTVIAVAAALLGAGALSLAIHAIVTILIEVALLWAAIEWRPRRHWRSDELKELFRFGWPLVGRRGIDYLVQQGDRFVIGYVFGAGALGLYAVALRLVERVIDRIDAIFDRVAFPVFTHTRDDPRRTRRGFLDAVRLQAVVIFPLAIGLGFLARELIPVVLGSRWTSAGPLMVLVACRAAIASLGVLPRAVLLAAGQGRILLGMSVVAAVVFVFGWAIGIPWGVSGVVAAGAVASAFMSVLAVWLARSEVGVTMGAWLRALLPAFVATGLMAGGILVTHLLLSDHLGFASHTRLAVLVVVGGLCYVLPLLPWIRRERRRYRAIPETRAPPNADPK